MPDRVGAVVIGRNEAARLADALGSVRAAGLRCIYVDSASSDESVAIGQRLADIVLELDASRPLSAARARNEGLAALKAASPQIDLVLFLDGDCILEPGFVPSASAVMDTRAEVAIVVGRLIEKPVPGNPFSRLAALEWSSGSGDISDFGNLGGIMLARVAPVQQVGGFNPLMIAGEDSELGVRLALGGFVVTKIDHPMAQHDACITSFRQWWTRSVRAGHALTERYMLHGKSTIQDCRREFKSTLFWGIGVPAAAILPAYWTCGASLLLLFGFPYLGWRIYGHYRRAGASKADAFLGARFGLYAKFANALGLIRYARRRLTGQVQIIEYKQSAIKRPFREQ
jgi:GT2 family glycosyltransferase